MVPFSENDMALWLKRAALIIVVNYILFCANSDFSTTYYHLFWSNDIVCWWVMLLFLDGFLKMDRLPPMYLNGVPFENKRLVKRGFKLTLIYLGIMIVSAIINTVIGVLAFKKALFYQHLEIQVFAFIMFAITLYIFQLSEIVKGLVGRFAPYFDNKKKVVIHYVIMVVMYIITAAAELYTLADEKGEKSLSPGCYVGGVAVIVVYVAYAAYISRKWTAIRLKVNRKDSSLLSE
ncbi:MAG: hypothetical protein II699_03745 [Lachnospiraceae bacterium]|nr:hypothetical protein [Lachnospiraceae bacterium]